MRALLVVLIVALALGAGAGCAPPIRGHGAITPWLSPSASGPTQASSPPTRPVTTVRMVAWHGPVEELFVHPLVIDPALAFRSDSLGMGFQEYFVTALEFRRILDQLWANGWTLVDVHRAAEGRVRVPIGRKPLVLSEDDVNYYHYFDGRGLASRLVLAGDRVQAQLPDGALTDEDVVPLVEAEVVRHPQLSADGAKGVLAVTGYEGLFGEHDLDRPAARARVTALAHWLVGHGWTLASHTWGHIDLSQSSAAQVAADTARWQALAEPLIGRVDVLIYPFGARPDDATVRQLADAGYRIQLDIDILARTAYRDGAILMSRRHVDGYALEVPPQQQRFYDVAAVRDPARPMVTLP